ncbi:MAG TPA: helix-turn-helix transcriptional regulator [Gaiellaceae bacterium]|nr:helix-turn-helix transcriptional regulator [Gaiellaceae bacterium]
MEAARREEILAAYRQHAERLAELAHARERYAGRRLSLVEEHARPLSRRELEVLALVAEGYTSKEIGARLFVSEETVKSHISNILACLGARNRAHAVAIALREGVLAVDR